MTRMLTGKNALPSLSPSPSRTSVSYARIPMDACGLAEQLQEFFFLVGVLLRSSSPGNPHQLRFECSAVLEDLCADVITELFILKNLTRSYVVVSVCVFLSTRC